MNKATQAALVQTGAFTEDDLAALDLAEGERGIIANWSPDDYAAALGDVAKAIVARQAVALVKAGDAPEVGRQVVLPEKPPYLQYDAKKDEMVGYDPHDPSQYWTDPATGELWRWDGKGRGRKAGVPNPWPYGEPRRVAIVAHKTVDGVRVPDAQSMHDANYNEYDWFHQGYNCWVTKGGKLTGEVEPAIRRRVIAAMNSLSGDSDLIRRPLRSA